MNNNFADFSCVRMDEQNPKWEHSISREIEIYKKDYDIRNPFERDLHRLTHSNGYRRLKNKTQVFFAPQNDHICTRIEHVTHVSLVAETIARYLRLNTDLVRAIATGHDIGHAPFGHQGETILNEIAKKYELKKFWHEGNSLHFIDNIETLPDYQGYQRNLDLSYAVRDGIVCHCGEVDDKILLPRNSERILSEIKREEKECAFTYEGCVVKISDKIGYIGRDIEDALSYGILSEYQIQELEDIIQNTYKDLKLTEINTTVLMHKFIIDLCENSSPELGLCFSDDCFKALLRIKKFNYENIYNHSRLLPFKNYARLIINTIFDKLDELYGINLVLNFKKEKNFFPELIKHFEDWLIKYSNYDLEKKKELKLENKIVYNLEEQDEYRKAIIDFISGMSDNFAIATFNEIISF
ncbi:HD domain-containing protein [bacterium]|nr:HD domain-containing protein [bacterium]